jgi:hypothetical protein
VTDSTICTGSVMTDLTRGSIDAVLTSYPELTGCRGLMEAIEKAEARRSGYLRLAEQQEAEVDRLMARLEQRARRIWLGRG